MFGGEDGILPKMNADGFGQEGDVTDMIARVEQKMVLPVTVVR